jgi:GDPmannose 4,6-dehydratase
MWLMLQQPRPDDFVIGTGRTHSVRELVDLAFRQVGLDWQRYVKVDQALVRPAEVDILQADPRKARTGLGWAPEVSFEQLVAMMVDADLQRLSARR